MASLSTILSWFKTGLKPTENQFAQSWSSFWHKDDSLPQTSITGLQDILNSLNQSTQQPDTITFTNTTGVYIIPAGKMLTVLIVESATDQILSVGSAAGLNDMMDSEQIPAGQPYALRMDILATRVNSRTIFLTYQAPLTISFLKENFYKQ
jgi:hypothetical protein